LSAQVVIFLGPSLPHRAARAILPADYRGPAAKGDLARAAKDGADTIALIDGRFDQRLAVGPAEILRVMRAGVRVYGASSMGALRAAELHDEGMEGVGQVFEWYRDGVIEAEDEVALIYDAESFRALTIPMVSIRSILKAAQERSLTDALGARRVLRAARQVHYSERNLGQLLIKARLEMPSINAILKIERNGAFDVKADDARKLLRHLARWVQCRK
jgi:hypothetical protein